MLCYIILYCTLLHYVIFYCSFFRQYQKKNSFWSIFPPPKKTISPFLGNPKKPMNVSANFGERSDDSIPSTKWLVGWWGIVMSIHWAAKMAIVPSSKLTMFKKLQLLGFCLSTNLPWILGSVFWLDFGFLWRFWMGKSTHHKPSFMSVSSLRNSVGCVFFLAVEWKPLCIGA